MRTSVILPTYNEKGNIVELITTVIRILDAAKIGFEVIVVDDNSPDGTADEVIERFGKDNRVRVFVRKYERGLATAVRYGIDQAAGDIVVVMDTDFNHNPEKIPLLVKYLEDFDIVVGSRFVGGGGMKGLQLRYWGSYLFNAFIKLMLGIRSNDNLSGFFAIRKPLLSELPVENIFKDYGDYFIRLLYLVHQRNLSILEIPVVYDERLSGASKTNFLWHVINYTITVIKLFFRKFRVNYPNNR